MTSSSKQTPLPSRQARKLSSSATRRRHGTPAARSAYLKRRLLRGIVINNGRQKRKKVLNLFCRVRLQYCWHSLKCTYTTARWCHIQQDCSSLACLVTILNYSSSNNNSLLKVCFCNKYFTETLMQLKKTNSWTDSIRSSGLCLE